MKRKFNTRAVVRTILSSVFLSSSVFTVTQAADVYYNATGTGSYLDLDSRWQGGVAPVSGDNVYLTDFSSSDRLVYYRYGGDGSHPATNVPDFGTLLVDQYGGGSMTLRSSGSYPNGNLSTDNIYIGYDGTGELYQLTGTVTNNGTLALGYNTGGNGTYTMTGGVLQAPDGIFSLVVGNYGTGTFNQSDGDVRASTNTVGVLYLGKYSGSDGSYNLSGAGTLTAWSEHIGSQGVGMFNQSGGTNTVNYLLSVSNAGGTGTYTMTGGTLEASDGGFDIRLGTSGTGNFNQSAGTVNMGNESLFVGYSSVGTYELSGSGTVTAHSEYIGRSGNGTFNQYGGTHTVNDAISLGYNSDGDGTYNMIGGTLQASDSGMDIFVGVSGSGQFNISNGTVDLGDGTLSVSSPAVGGGRVLPGRQRQPGRG